MKTFIIALLAVVGIAVAACAQQKQTMNQKQSDRKILVAYFSATGTTAKVAKQLAAATSADLYEIQPEQPYTSADLDWNNKKSRSSVEMDNQAARPALKGTKENIADYDLIFLGYPIWWDLAPRVINTFIEVHSLKGKVVVPFATSGSSSISNSVSVLKKTYPEIRWQSGKLCNRISEQSLREWAEKF